MQKIGLVLLSFSLALAGLPANALPTVSNVVETQNVQIFLKRATSDQLPDNTGIFVKDAASGDVLVNQKADDQQLSASVMKVVTAVVALETYGPDYRVTTHVYWDANTNSVYLKGAGDPLLTTTRIKGLAKLAAKNLPTDQKINVVADASLFPDFQLPAGWPSSYVPSEVRPVSALAIYGSNSKTPAKEAGKLFRDNLVNYGINARFTGQGVAAGVEIAKTKSLYMTKLVKEMLEYSNNNTAETLFRLSAAGSHNPTWENASTHAHAILKRIGINSSDWKLIDGSGLSRSNRLTARGMTNLLLETIDPSNPNLNVILDRGLLPLAGSEGTLRTRYKDERTKCAAGLVEAKTGTLFDTVGLAGFARTENDGLAVFTVLANSVPSRSHTSIVRSRIDYMVSGLTGCNLPTLSPTAN